MTTLFSPDPCQPPARIPEATTVREIVYLASLLKQALPDLEYLEGGTRTSEARRKLIEQIEYINGGKQ